MRCSHCGAEVNISIMNAPGFYCPYCGKYV